jgi:hypothetical protein
MHVPLGPRRPAFACSRSPTGTALSQIDVRSRIDDIGSWTEYIKHDILRRQLPARRTVLYKHRHWFPGGDYYVDAFAGAGMARLRDEDRLVKGSPRIALELPHPFDRYWFMA